MIFSPMLQDLITKQVGIIQTQAEMLQAENPDYTREILELRIMEAMWLKLRKAQNDENTSTAEEH